MPSPSFPFPANGRDLIGDALGRFSRQDTLIAGMTLTIASIVMADRPSQNVLRDKAAKAPNEFCFPRTYEKSEFTRRIEMSGRRVRCSRTPRRLGGKERCDDGPAALTIGLAHAHGHLSHVADAHMTKPDFGQDFYTLNPPDSDMTVTLLPEQHTNLAR